jgi:citronellol/citronellal dehydrogenase
MAERSLKDAVLVVTGSARGAGRAIALELAAQGARVVVADRTETPFMLPGTIYTVAGEIKEQGGTALPVKVDLRHEEEIVALRDAVLREFGTVDGVVNNAGITFHANVWELPTERWDQVMGVNPRGTFLVCKYLLPSMLEQRSGAIVNISSSGGRGPGANMSVYAASKAAVDYFTLSLAEEVRPYNIAVNALAPTAMIDTEGTRHLWGEGAASNAEPAPHFARVAAWLLKQDAAGVTGNLLYSRQVAAKFGICKEWCCGGNAPVVGGSWRVKWEESLPAASYDAPDEELLARRRREG